MFIISFIKMWQSFAYKFREDFIGSFAAQAAFFIFLSFFPFMMFIITVMNQLPIDLSVLSFDSIEVVPAAVLNYIIQLMSDLQTGAPSGTLLIITAITALWSASKGFLAIDRGLSFVYDTRENRPYLVLRFRSFIYTIIFAVVIILLLLLLVFGNQVYEIVTALFPKINDLALLVMSFRTLLTMAILVIFFLCIYLFIPNRRSKFFAELPGAIVCTIGWWGFSYIYSIYINYGSASFAFYGSLTTIVICMLWLYCCMSIMFVGAEINTIIANQNIRNALRVFLLHRKSKKLYK